MIAHYIIFSLQVLTIITCFIYSLRLLNKKLSPGYMKFFILYPVIAFVVTMVYIIDLINEIPILNPNGESGYFPFPDKMGFLVVNISIVVHYFILSIIIFKIQNPKYFPSGQIVLMVIGWALLFYTLFWGGWFAMNLKAQLTANLFLVIFSLFYFRSLLNNVSVLNLKKDPGFWIAVGILVGIGMSLPVLVGIIPFSTVLKSIYIKYFVDFTCISTSIMYLAFIKAIRCTQII